VTATTAAATVSSPRTTTSRTCCHSLGQFQLRSAALATARTVASIRSFTSSSSAPLRGLDEAFPDLKARFLDMALDAPPRRHHKDAREKRGTLMPHPYPKVFPLLTLKQRDHFFKRYRKNSGAAAAAAAGGLSSTSAALLSHEQQHAPKAAVLVLLCTVNGEPSVVLTRRSSRLSSHAGEISFPGGHYDARHDANLLDTALREAQEELAPADPRYLELDEASDGQEGVEADSNKPRLTMLGPTTSVPSLKGIPVKPFVAAILRQNFTHPISSVFPGDPSEVDLVFAMPVRQLLRTETTHELPQNRFGMVHAPLFPTPYGSDIWGLTAFILRPLLHKLLKPVLAAEEGDSTFISA
jgi:nudix motif 8